jgi:hypothetical protein
MGSIEGSVGNTTRLCENVPLLSGSSPWGHQVLCERYAEARYRVRGALEGKHEGYTIPESRQLPVII